MIREHLDDFINSASPEDRAQRKDEALVLRTLRMVLSHKSIVSGEDLERLEAIAKTSKSERHRMSADKMLATLRFKHVQLYAHLTATREQVMEDKGLRKDAQVNVINFNALDPEKLKALLEWKPASLPAAPRVVDVEPEEPTRSG